jgi:hypothetical protein
MKAAEYTLSHFTCADFLRKSARMCGCEWTNIDTNTYIHIDTNLCTMYGAHHDFKIVSHMLNASKMCSLMYTTCENGVTRSVHVCIHLCM